MPRRRIKGQLGLFKLGRPIFRPGLIPEKTATCTECGKTIIVALLDELSGQQVSGFVAADGRCYDCTFKGVPKAVRP